MTNSIFKYIDNIEPFKNDPIVFFLPESAVQEVAKELLNRKLTEQEIKFAQVAFYSGKHPIIELNAAIQCAVKTAEGMSAGTTKLDSDFFLQEKDIETFVKESNSNFPMKFPSDRSYDTAESKNYTYYGGKHNMEPWEKVVTIMGLMSGLTPPHWMAGDNPLNKLICGLTDMEAADAEAAIRKAEGLGLIKWHPNVDQPKKQ